MKLIRQVIYDIRQQKIVSWLSVIGTAMAIFLVMTVYMLNGVHKIEAEPELNRSRIFYGTGIHLSHESGDASSSFSLDYGRKLYENLEGVEKLSFTTSYNGEQDVQIGKGEPIQSMVKGTDNVFWKIYDFNFTEGGPYDQEDCEAGTNKCVVSERLKEKLVGKEESLVGKEIMLDFIPYQVTGVIDNNNPLLNESYADVYTALSTVKDIYRDEEREWFGSSEAHLLAKPGVKLESLCKQVASRYELLNKESKDDGFTFHYHGQPYSSEVMAKGNFGSNTTPDMKDSTMQTWLIYIILLLLPAINLSTMNRSRMNRRISEIGVRRAYGAKRVQIIGQLLTENMILTLVGGALGLILSLIFASWFSQYVVSFVSQWNASYEQIISAPQFSMIFKWEIFLFAFLFCFILNIFSAGIPAWKASRVNPAEALGSRGR